APRRSRAQCGRPSGDGEHRSWPPSPSLHEGTNADTAYLEHHATAASRGLPMAIEHLGVEHVRRAENAVARQRFCPLQGIVFVIFLKGGRPKRGICHQRARKIAFSDGSGIVSALPTSCAAIDLTATAPINLTAAARARYRRITSFCSLRGCFSTIASESELDYFRHV